MDATIWKKLKGFDNYEISNYGEVKNIVTNTLLKGNPKKRYIEVNLTNNKKAYNMRLHRIIALIFCPNPNKYRFVNHKDGNRYNNAASNLEWCTAEDNLRHALETGLIVRKLERSHIIEIFELRLDGWNMVDLATYFNVNPGTIGSTLYRHNGRLSIDMEKEYPEIYQEVQDIRGKIYTTIATKRWKDYVKDEVVKIYKMRLKGYTPTEIGKRYDLNEDYISKLLYGGVQRDSEYIRKYYPLLCAVVQLTKYHGIKSIKRNLL